MPLRRDAMPPLPYALPADVCHDAVFMPLPLMRIVRFRLSIDYFFLLFHAFFFSLSSFLPLF